MKIRKKVFLLIMASVIMAATVGLPGTSRAVEVNIGVGVAVPPPYVFSAPPNVVLIPGTYVYYVPGIPEEILFYNGWWFRFYGGRWFRSRVYGGPWVFAARPPRPLLALPPDFRHLRGPAIPYRDLRGHWRSWQKTRYWESHREWPERGRGRGRGGREEHRERGNY